MPNFFRGLIAFIAFALAPLASHATPQADVKQYRITDYALVGLNQTDPHWLLSYIQYKIPGQMVDNDLQAIRSKLLTTEVFTEVDARFEPLPDEGQGEHYRLIIAVREKWTLIPVIRGAYGGGTPLRVVGVYDTHSFGRLWTLGAEGHRYGEAPWSGVVWARAPRYLDGYHELGYEFWRMFRLRSIYDEDEHKLGELRSDWTMARFLYMMPLPVITRHLKLGIDMRVRQEAPIRYKAENDYPDSEPKGIRLTETNTRQFSPMLRTVYDTLAVDNLLADGLRLIVNMGPLFEKDEIHSRYEAELFYFNRFATNWNLGVHALAGQTTTNSLESQYFIGGFESVRGLPDGILYGNRATYANFELRHLTFRLPRVFVQPVLFSDIGGAAQTWKDTFDSFRSSAGVGVRFAVPQVYRLMFRIDYAWSLDHPGTSGISLGMNQFFQPYKPL